MKVKYNKYLVNYCKFTTDTLNPYEVGLDCTQTMPEGIPRLQHDKHLYI